MRFRSGSASLRSGAQLVRLVGDEPLLWIHVLPYGSEKLVQSAHQRTDVLLARIDLQRRQVQWRTSLDFAAQPVQRGESGADADPHQHGDQDDQAGQGSNVSVSTRFISRSWLAMLRTIWTKIHCRCPPASQFFRSSAEILTRRVASRRVAASPL